MAKKFTVILVCGEYDSYDFTQKHKGETHTAEEWENMAKEEGLTTVTRTFPTLEAQLAYKLAVEDVENYLSSDFYTYQVITL
jgi:hypothetical protein